MPPFRYFELLDEVAGTFEFWEIAIDGPLLDQRYGPVGTPGHHVQETCSSEEHARREYVLRIEEKQEQGYRETLDRRLDARTRTLEDAIVDNPDDAAAYMVYADWIQTLGDVRGTLIVAQIAEADGVPGAAARAAAFLGQHAPTFLGPLADHVGFDGAILEPTWRYGFIRRARIYVGDAWGRDPERVLEWLLDHASARWLDALVIETHPSDQLASLELLVEALARRPRPSLRELTLGDVGGRKSGTRMATTRRGGRRPTSRSCGARSPSCDGS